MINALADSKWQKASGHLLDIGAGANGFVWGIGLEKGIWSWTGTTWKKQQGCAKPLTVAVDKNGAPGSSNATLGKSGPGVRPIKLRRRG